MQSNIFEPTNLPELPQPGFIDHRILESPIPLSLICIVIGILIFATLRHSKHAKSIGRPAILLGFLAGIGIYLTGHFITNDREHLKINSSKLIKAVASGDTQVMNQLMAGDIEVKASFFNITGKERVIAQASTQGAAVIKSASLRETQTGIFGQQMARTHVKVRVSGDMLPPLSWWSIDWTRASPNTDHWVATHIESLWIQGFSNP